MRVRLVLHVLQRKCTEEIGLCTLRYVSHTCTKKTKKCWLNLFTFLKSQEHSSCRHVLAWNSCNLFDIWAGPKNCHGSHPQDEYATLLLWSNYLLDKRRLPNFLKNEIGSFYRPRYSHLPLFYWNSIQHLKLFNLTICFVEYRKRLSPKMQKKHTVVLPDKSGFSLIFSCLKMIFLYILRYY